MQICELFGHMSLAFKCIPFLIKLSVDRGGALVWLPHVHSTAELEQTRENNVKNLRLQFQVQCSQNSSEEVGGSGRWCTMHVCPVLPVVRACVCRSIQVVTSGFYSVSKVSLFTVALSSRGR